MKAALVEINQWEKPIYYLFDNFDIKINEYVVVETSTNIEVGKITDIKEIKKEELDILEIQSDIKNIKRKATLKDLEKLEDFEKNKGKSFEICRTLIEKHQLPMKLIDIHFSFDDKKITFAFIAESRVDFRQLVKDLTKNFQKNIRLQQLGVRDEAKINGDVGACGVIQCCKTHLRELGNVSAEQAEIQQVSHRGPERLSGICNRLKCCLRYENELYDDLAKNLPAIGTTVKTPRGKGEVVEWHVLKQAVNVKLEEDQDTILEVPVDKIN